jgi:hypothetical protein
MTITVILMAYVPSSAGFNSHVANHPDLFSDAAYGEWTGKRSTRCRKWDLSEKAGFTMPINVASYPAT